MRDSLFLLIGLSLLFSGQASATESCFLRSYVTSLQNAKAISTVPLRDVTFEVPVIQPGGGTIDVEVTRILSGPSASPRLKELFEFMDKNKIVLTRNPVPELTGENTTYITVSGDALLSEQNLIDRIDGLLLQRNIDYAPLRTNRLNPSTVRVVDKMKSNFGTKFFEEPTEQGISYPFSNKVGIKSRHPDNLRVNGVANHEFTHNTTSRKVLEAFDPSLGRPLSPSLAGREMAIVSKDRVPMKFSSPLEGYRRRYSSDEIEAHIRELARAKFDKQDLEKQLIDLNEFIDVQETQLKDLLKNKPQDMNIVTGDIEDELMSGRRQRRNVTAANVDFNIQILVPKGLTNSEEASFIESALKKRLETLGHYRKTIEAKFPKS